MRTKYVCLTLNNYTSADVIHMRSLVGRGLATYAVFGRETGASGTRHLQAYAELPTRLRLNQLREIFPRCHIEARRGNPTQAKDYCCKDGDFEEFGEISLGGQGFRSDLAELHESLRNGKRLRSVADDHFASFIRYPRAIAAYKTLHPRKRDINVPPSVIIYYGRTGTGKTRSIWDNLRDQEDLWVYTGAGWFDGYDEHPIVLFDDFSGGEFKITMLLRLLDRYPMRVPIKGGFVNWCPQEIYITSNIDPLHWYPNANPEHIDALFRRITNKVKFE